MISVVFSGLCIGVGLIMLTMPTITQRCRDVLAATLPKVQARLRQRMGDRHRTDLALTERVAQDMVVQKLVGGLIGCFSPIACGALITTIGGSPSTSLLLLGSFSCGILGFVLPDRMLRNTAARPATPKPMVWCHAGVATGTHTMAHKTISNQPTCGQRTGACAANTAQHAPVL